MPASKVKEMYPKGDEGGANDAFGNNQLLGEDRGGAQDDDDYTVTDEESILTKSEDKIYTESVVSLDLEQ